MESKHLEFSFRSRYYTLGNPGPDLKHVWLICHGYGQLAAYFVKKFECLMNENTMLIAPEGLSRFYLNHKESRVGASWMTREDRLVDIQNYLEYLNQVFENEVKPCLRLGKAKLTLFGFSQGVSTVFRFAAQDHIPFDRLIMWAGTVPPDLDYEKIALKFSHAQVLMVYGDQDQYVNEKYLLEQKQALQKLDITPDIRVFQGNHRLDEATLRELASDY